ncbi:thioredoxin family protein [Bizionia sp. KMM 8389]
MNKNKCLITIFLIGFFFARAQNITTINWKNWSELEQALIKKPKPVFIFFHAKWCAYCKKIEREIFTKPKVIQKLNTDYYAVEMNVESRDTITFEGTNFTNKQALTKRNGVHEIPLLLASRNDIPFSLPATIILNKDFTIKNRVFEYYTSKQLLCFLN